MLQKARDEMIADSVSLGNVRLEEPTVFCKGHNHDGISLLSQSHMSNGGFLWSLPTILLIM